jgi:Caspase domain
MRLLFILMLLLPLWPTSAHAQTTRAVFVGIDSYQFSTAKNPQATFKDLRGAVADTVRFKNVLREKYSLDLDRTPQGQCPDTTHPVSITLLNRCATRAEIIAALNQMIDRSGPNDTVLFYFAGHGSQYADQEYTQSSGYNGTILPTDARNPLAEAEGDILDRELRRIKERAVAKGIYFVSIFDSCNSGTATRDGAAGQSRNVPPLKAKPPLRPAGPEPIGPGGGYWVHLAAAQDGEQAQEVGAVGKREGVFTTALIDTMREMPAATFGDIMREVQAKLVLRACQSKPDGRRIVEGPLWCRFDASHHL